MRPNASVFYGLMVILSIFTACKKENEFRDPRGNNGNPNKPDTSKPSNPGNPANPDSIYVVKVKAVIGVGELIYDSIPASLQVISWDSSNVQHQRQLSLQPGTNSVNLPKAHKKYQLKLTQWGITDEMSFTKAELAEGTVITLGGTKQAKKLQREESFLLVQGNYQPRGKTLFYYNGSGLVNKVDYYQKKPQHSDLQLTVTDKYVLSGARVDKINRLDGSGLPTGFTEFTYDAQGKVVNMHQKSYDQETFAAVEYGYASGGTEITIDYLYSNGNAMEYKMKFRGGNKIEDVARSSTGGGEGGNYGYDFAINPYAQMNMPDLYLSNLSKNNIASQQKGYGGNIPSAVPYRFEYQYDADGYPVVLITSYKSYTTGEELYKIKKVFTY
ncbi:MAG TPA: hypothetical protein VGD17_04880 [Chitinophagaceae bacterium]